VRRRCGTRRGAQLGAFINAMIRTINETGVIGMDAAHAEALSAFRAFNYEAIYLRDSSREQAGAVVSMLRGLVEYYAEHPLEIPDVNEGLVSPADDASRVHEAVAYVAGMTDRYACRLALEVLHWPVEQLPRGVDR